ncbi:MAG: BMP family ABC transporter substrate-binding protein [Proteobacteria bacterium]|nr:BMP family ABC transporter substrate-binding protein [Pseudomonadota bacterium]MBU6424970.1 BMP family ABC transporter substrate-binding protein [Rhodospirillales bacterium]
MKLTKLAGLALAALVAAAPAAQAQVKIPKPKIAFIFLGTATDGGWSQSQDTARLALAKAYGKVPFVENVPEQTDKVEQAVDLFISHGGNVIIAGSYGYSDAMAAEAKAHPNLAFINMAGISSAPNLESPYPKTYQGWYLAGMAAGYATKSKQLGMMLGFPIPDVLWDINSFALGAQATNPGTIVHVAFVNSWSDPVKEAQISQAMIQQGADVIATDMDSPAALVVAEKAGKYSVGYQVDMGKSAPNGILTSVVFHWEKELLPAVAAMKAGTWKSQGTPLYGIDTGVVDIAPLEHIPADDIAKIKAVRQKMIAGSFDVWAGPIKDQSGKVEVPAGSAPTIDQLWNMNYLVSNVKGSMK